MIRIGGAVLSPLAFADVSGWDDKDAAEVWPAFLLSAEHLREGSAALRPALPSSPALLRVAAAAKGVPASQAREFFQRYFAPYRVGERAQGFVTAYYEPCVEGATEASDAFRAPILARPRDLPAAPESYPDRRAIRHGAIGRETEPVVWLRDAVEVFLIQVQGSARVTLADGAVLRLVYDGRNGRPYTSIGKLLIKRGAIAPDAMSLAALKAWLRENGAGCGGPADEIMDANGSYVFFRAEPQDDPTRGPIGGQGIPLTAERSIAIDRALWPYGLPFWIDADVPGGGFRRLAVGQDTGSAILGAARADLFFGSGETAGERAGLVRHPATMVVFLPKDGTA